MFDKAAKVMKLIKARSGMEKKLDPIWATLEKGNYKVTVNANKKIVSIEENGQENKMLRDLINDATKEAQKKAEKKMKASGEDFGLGDML